MGLALATALGCGPSFQAVHEGESRFEHCYALDESSQVPLEKKADCWNDWARHYTYGQTRDRVQYAVQRYQALSRVPSLPTDEAMMSAAPGEGVSNSPVTAPAPTSPFAPPPKTIAVADGGVDAAAPSPQRAPVAPAVAARPPGAECLDECEVGWNGCRNPCTGK